MVRSQPAGARCHSRESISAATPAAAHQASATAMKPAVGPAEAGVEHRHGQPGALDQVPELRFSRRPHPVADFVKHPPQPGRTPGFTQPQFLGQHLRQTLAPLHRSRDQRPHLAQVSGLCRANPRRG